LIIHGEELPTLTSGTVGSLLGIMPCCLFPSIHLSENNEVVQENVAIVMIAHAFQKKSRK
jgi:hypothetical protein